MRLLKQVLVIGLMFFAVASTGSAAGIVALPDLESVTIYERTGGSTATGYLFDFDDGKLSSQVTGTLNAGNSDFFIGPTSEYYDVFYSNADGTLNPNGSYITVTSEFEDSGDSGLNLAGVSLNFASGPDEFANSVASYVTLGSLPYPGLVGNAVDGDLTTHTLMGDTEFTTEKLRVTVGFASTAPVPEPTSLVLLSGLGAMGLVAARRRKKHAA